MNSLFTAAIQLELARPVKINFSLGKLDQVTDLVEEVLSSLQGHKSDRSKGIIVVLPMLLRYIFHKYYYKFPRLVGQIEIKCY